MDTKETQIFIALLIAALVLLLVITFFVWNALKYHQRKLLMTHQLMLAEIAAIEQERARIARDLHDVFGALVATIQINIQSLEKVDPSDQQYLDRIAEKIDAIQEKTRDVAMNLIPQILERKGLVAALEHFVEGLHSSHAMRIYLTTDGYRAIVNKEIELHIYRIVQEITTNAIKHAAATVMQINLTIKGKKIILTIEDDGKGFVSANEQQKGFGLQTMRGRVSLLQGSIALETALGKGTRYIIELPTVMT